MHSFDWLQTEIEEIRTQKFHLLGAEGFPGRARGEIDWPIEPPPSYRRFIELFGRAFLYRESSYHLIRIEPRPVLETDKKGQEYLCFGGYDCGDACFRKDLLLPNEESPVFETRGMSGLFQTASTFPEWLFARHKAARKHFTRSEWREILKGPEPFTPDEQKIVAARSQYEWQIVGVSATGNVVFRVTNKSDRKLPFLSVGIKATNLLGGIWLPVGAVEPGTSREVEVDAYRGLVDPREIEAFQEPDPGPEDRERYGEFQNKE